MNTLTLTFNVAPLLLCMYWPTWTNAGGLFRLYSTVGGLACNLWPLQPLAQVQLQLAAQTKGFLRSLHTPKLGLDRGGARAPAVQQPCHTQRVWVEPAQGAEEAHPQRTLLVLPEGVQGDVWRNSRWIHVDIKKRRKKRKNLRVISLFDRLLKLWITDASVVWCKH